jgi:prepilin-type N-terminal cleavage/methylation domain-containing protein
MSCEAHTARAAGLDPAVRRDRQPRRCRRPGFTIVELCVTLAILGLLLALILPAVQSVRGAARLTECQNHLHQIGTALHQYEGVHQMWAPGASNGLSWHVAILPMIERRDLFDLVRTGSDPKSSAALIQYHQIDVYLCPADNAPAVTPDYDGDAHLTAATSYQGNSGTGLLHGGFNGLFRHLNPWQPALYNDGPVRSADILDGLSNTAAVSEVLHGTNEFPFERLRGNWNLTRFYTAAELDEFRADCEALPTDPWGAGWRGSPVSRGWSWSRGNNGYSMYNHALAPNRPSCFDGTDVMRGIYTAASRHAGVVQVLYADNHNDGVSESVDRNVWIACGSRSGGEPLSLP